LIEAINKNYIRIKEEIRKSNFFLFYLVPLGVEINPQFYWGKIKSFSMRKPP